MAAKSPNDGYTFLVGAVHHAIAVSMYKKLPYEPKGLAPVTLIAVAPNVVVLHPVGDQVDQGADRLREGNGQAQLRFGRQRTSTISPPSCSRPPPERTSSIFRTRARDPR
jgi:hypothetical protein